MARFVSEDTGALAGRAPDGASPSTPGAQPGDAGQLTSRPPSNPICFGGEDWLTLSLYLRHRSFGKTVELLDRHRQAAEAKRQGEDELCLGDQQFLVLPMGAKVGRAYFRWQLRSSTGYELQLMNRPSCEGTMPNAKLVATSLVLMRLGVEEVVRQAFAALEALGAQVVQDKVSRVDLCCDLPDRKIEPLKAAFDAGHVVSRASRSDEYGCHDNFIESDYSLHRIRKEVTSFNAGYGATRVRVYEKILECRFDYEKLETLVKHRWGVFPFRAIRIEFELRRKKLKERLSVDSFADWLAKRASIGHYLSHSWLRLTDGPVDRKHPDRTPTLPEWLEVQAAMASWTGSGPMVDLGPIPTQPMPADHYLKSIVGMFVSLFAKSHADIDGNETFGQEAMCLLLDEIEDRDMAAEVRRRALELGVADVRGKSC